MAVAQLLLSMEPKYICHNQCTMDTSSPIVPKLSTEILLIPAILELYHKPPLKERKYRLRCFCCSINWKADITHATDINSTANGGTLEAFSTAIGLLW